MSPRANEQRANSQYSPRIPDSDVRALQDNNRYKIIEWEISYFIKRMRVSRMLGTRNSPRPLVSTSPGFLAVFITPVLPIQRRLFGRRVGGWSFVGKRVVQTRPYDRVGGVVRLKREKSVC